MTGVQTCALPICALFTGQVYGVLTTEEAAGILRTIGLDMTVTDGSGTASETVNV